MSKSAQRPGLLAWLLVAPALVGLLWWVRQSSVSYGKADAKMDRLERDLKQAMDPNAPDYSVTWTSTNGSHTVNTYCKDGESEDACRARHNARVAAQQKAYPPIK